jgi:glycosyltransferase involved in cell wall biosynthesis
MSDQARAQADVWVVIPAFNEGGAISETLATLVGLPYRIVVVDDGSVDDTWERAHDARVTVLRHACNLGQGAALQTGITYALRQGDTGYVVTFDADGQHCAADIAQMLAPLLRDECDVTLASRFAPGGVANEITTGRKIVLHLAVLLARATTGLPLTDTHNGLRAFTAAAARQISLSQNRMAHASEILSQIASRTLRFREVPATVRYTAYSRAKGQSLSNGLNILWDILMARIR